MEIIIFVAVVVVAALLWSGYVKTKKAESDQTIDNWQPPKQAVPTEKEWPFGEKLSEGKIHVRVADIVGSENQVETPAPTAADATAENKAKAVAKAKRAPAKASEVKTATAKAPRKPKTV